MIRPEGANRSQQCQPASSASQQCACRAHAACMGQGHMPPSRQAGINQGHTSVRALVPSQLRVGYRAVTVSHHAHLWNGLPQLRPAGPCCAPYTVGHSRWHREPRRVEGNPANARAWMGWDAHLAGQDAFARAAGLSPPACRSLHGAWTSSPGLSERLQATALLALSRGLPGTPAAGCPYRCPGAGCRLPAGHAHAACQRGQNHAACGAEPAAVGARGSPRCVVARLGGGVLPRCVRRTGRGGG